MPIIGQRETNRKEIRLMMPLKGVLRCLDESEKIDLQKDSKIDLQKDSKIDLQKDSKKVLFDNRKLVEKLPDILTQLKAYIEESNSLTGRIKARFVDSQDSQDYREDVKKCFRTVKGLEAEIGGWVNLLEQDNDTGSELAIKIKEGLANVPITVDGEKTSIGDFKGSLSDLFKSILKGLAKLKSQLISVFANTLIDRAGDMSKALRASDSASASDSDNKAAAVIEKCEAPFFNAGFSKSVSSKPVSSKSVGSEQASAAAA